MATKDVIYVIGHKNPDTDSICSAIVYSDIKNRTDSKTFVPKRAGQINQETEFVLNRFGVEAPGYLADVGTQVKDMELHRTVPADSHITIKKAWELMKECGAVTLPITDRENRLEGIISVRDLAVYYMETCDSRVLADARAQYRSMAETVDGKVIVGNEHGYFMKGKILIAAANPHLLDEYVEENDLVILGDREDLQIKAIKNGASCIIVTLGAVVSQKVMTLAQKYCCVVITSPHDTYSVSRMVSQSIPVKHLMTSDIITFHMDDFTDNIQSIMGKYRHRDFPVLDKKDRYIGTVSRRNMLNIKKKKLILVDHNEKSQAVDNIEQAEIMEIIDHHRIGSLETLNPVYFRNQPVGCTATILYRIYREEELEIKPDMAGLLCAAIISDTLMFRSPTCTKWDQEACHELAQIAGIDIEEFATEMFRAGSDLSGKSSEEIFYQDFKKFYSGDIAFGVGQISSMDASEITELSKRLLPLMRSECGKNGISMVFFMITNIISESTILLCYGENSEKAVEEAFGVKVSKGSCYLAGVVSRKKQLIPKLIEQVQTNA